MTCYFRHLREFFKKANVEVTSDNKREIDRIIHNILNVEYKNCSTVWREVKKIIAENEEEFISTLKEELSKRVNT